MVVSVVRLKYSMLPPDGARKLAKAPRLNSQIRAGRGKDGRETQIDYERTLKAVDCNAARRVDRVRYYPYQHREVRIVPARRSMMAETGSQAPPIGKLATVAASPSKRASPVAGRHYVPGPQNTSGMTRNG